MFFYERLNNSQFEGFWDINQDKLALQKTTESLFSYETNSFSAKAAHYPTVLFSSDISVSVQSNQYFC